MDNMASNIYIYDILTSHIYKDFVSLNAKKLIYILWDFFSVKVMSVIIYNTLDINGQS